MEAQALKQDVSMAQEERLEFGVAPEVEAELYDSFDQPAQIQHQWDDFIESVGGEIFLTFDWCRIWWKHYGAKRSLRIFVFRSRGRLVGIIPAFFEKIRLGPVCVRAAKIVGTDFTPVAISIPIRSEFISKVVHKFCDMLADYNLDIVHIGPIAGLYGNFEQLKMSFEQSVGRNRKLIVKNNDVQTYFKIAKSLDEQLAGLKKSERKRIKKSCRACNETGALSTADVSIDDFSEAFDDFVRMHTSRWQKVGRPGHFEDWPGSRQFHREAAKAQLKLNRLRLQRVRLNDYCIGYQYCYRFGDKYFQYLDARANLEDIPHEFPHVSVGAIVFAEHLKRAFEENVRWFDSMRGKYEYKLRLGGRLFPVRNLYMYKNSPGRFIRVRLFALLAKFLHIVYYRLWYSRIAPALRLKPKGLWKIWIRTHALSLSG